MERTRLVGIALVIVSACAFGSGALFAQPVYATGIGWLSLLAWRFVFGAGLAWVVLLASPSGRSAFRRLARRRLLAALALGVLYVGNAGTYYASIETVDVSLAAIIVFLYPPLVAVLAVWFGAPLEGRRAWTALAIAVLGVALAVGGIDPSNPPPVLGLVLAAASPLIYSVWIILSARLGGERSGRVGTEADEGSIAQAATAPMMTATMAVFWLGALATGTPVLPADIPAAAWPGLVGIGVIATFVSIVAFYAGTHRIGAAQASLISTIEPVWTIALATIFLGERLGLLQLLGGALILGGVVLAQTSGARRIDGRPGDGLPRPLVRLADE